MLIVNADDWGRSRLETDAAWECYGKGRLTSLSAMVFMEDSERAAAMVKDSDVPVGLHLNLSQRFTGANVPKELSKQQDRIVRFLNFHKYALLLYNPFLRKEFHYVYQAQSEEFVRLYGKTPSHTDGHQHKHLCLNMLVDHVIPDGEKVRPTFNFSHHQKRLLNALYWKVTTYWLRRRYVTNDYFSSLRYCLEAGCTRQVTALAADANVEIMTHPKIAAESAYLKSDEFAALLRSLGTGRSEPIRVRLPVA